MNLRKLEKGFEFVLWNFRLFIIMPVIFGLLSSLNFFVIGSIEIFQAFKVNYVWSELKAEEVIKITAYIIGGVDLYLIGVILLIFSFGIYELFISKIDIRFKGRDSDVLVITSLEELKHKILQVVIVVLIVSLFKKVLTIEIKTTLDIIYVAASILLIAGSGYLMQAGGHARHHKDHKDHEQTTEESEIIEENELLKSELSCRIYTYISRLR